MIAPRLTPEWYGCFGPTTSTRTAVCVIPQAGAGHAETRPPPGRRSGSRNPPAAGRRSRVGDTHRAAAGGLGVKPDVVLARCCLRASVAENAESGASTG